VRPRPMPNAKTVDDGEDEKNVDTSNNIITMPWRAMVAWGPRRSIVIFEEEGDVDTISAGRFTKYYRRHFSRRILWRKFQGRTHLGESIISTTL